MRQCDSVLVTVTHSARKKPSRIRIGNCNLVSNQIRHDDILIMWRIFWLDSGNKIELVDLISSHFFFFLFFIVSDASNACWTTSLTINVKKESAKPSKCPSSQQIWGNEHFKVITAQLRPLNEITSSSSRSSRTSRFKNCVCLFLSVSFHPFVPFHLSQCLFLVDFHLAPIQMDEMFWFLLFTGSK